MTEKSAQTKAYLNWLAQNGLLMNKLEMPVNFDGTNGVRAKTDIQPNEAFLFVPNKLLITVESARQSEIAEVFKNHEQLFFTNLERDSLTVIVYLMHERLKGPESFWYPYFDALDMGKPAYLWPPEAIEMCDDPELRLQLRYDNQRATHLWEQIQKLIPVYPHYFSDFTRPLFEWAHQLF